MIAVIIVFQFFQHFDAGQFHPGCQQIQIIGHLCQYLILRNATDCSVRFIHTDILDIVQLTEDTQLRKFRDTGQEHIAQVRIASFQWTVEITHHIAKRRQVLFFMNHIEEWSIIFVDQNHHLSSGLLISTLYQCCKA